VPPGVEKQPCHSTDEDSGGDEKRKYVSVHKMPPASERLHCLYQPVSLSHTLYHAKRRKARRLNFY
jgi:hypothetical protein